jgi:hypothetical protein
MVQASENPSIKFNAETLNALSGRLVEYANAVLARKDTAADLRLATKACQRLASLRFQVAEIARETLDRPQRDSAVIARDLKEALDYAESAE